MQIDLAGLIFLDKNIQLILFIYNKNILKKYNSVKCKKYEQLFILELGKQ